MVFYGLVWFVASVAAFAKIAWLTDATLGTLLGLAYFALVGVAASVVFRRLQRSRS